MIRAAVRVAAGETVALGDYLGHSEGGARSQRGPLAPVRAFSKVIGPASSERSPDGSHRVKCELITTRPYRRAGNE